MFTDIYSRSSFGKNRVLCGYMHHVLVIGHERLLIAPERSLTRAFRWAMYAFTIVNIAKIYFK